MRGRYPRMRTRGLVVALAGVIAAIGVAATPASALTRTFTNNGQVAIPATGTQGVANPYPSEIPVTGFVGGTIQKATATVSGFSHTFPSDVAVLLVGPTGANTILFALEGGGTDVNNIDLTFDQSALNRVPTPMVSGTFQPTAAAGTTTAPFAAPAPGPPYNESLNVFNNTTPNGIWRLFVEDRAAADTGSFARGWSLTLNAPVNTLTAGKPKLNKKNGTARVPATVADAGQLTLSGKGVKTASASKSVAVAGPGTVNLTVKPKGKTRKKLNSTGKATVNVKITFTPTGGTPNAVTKKIKLKKTLR